MSTHSMNFDAESLDLEEYAINLSKDRFGGNFSIAIRDCIKAHKKATERYGDWRQMEDIPGWADEILTANQQG